MELPFLCRITSLYLSEFTDLPMASRSVNQPPEPIFYSGDLYWEKRISTKYNTPLVTCDRFSTSSAAPPKVLAGPQTARRKSPSVHLAKFGGAAFSELYFWVDMHTAVGGGFYPESSENSITGQNPPLVPTQ